MVVRGAEDVAKQRNLTISRHLLPTQPEQSSEGWRKISTMITDMSHHWKVCVGLAVSLNVYERKIATILGAKGWRTPEDVAIVGLGNESQIGTSVTPTISSIIMGYQRNDYQAAELLGRLMNGKEVQQESLTPPK